MSVSHGSKSVLHINSVDFSQYVTKDELDRSRDSAEVTVKGDTSKAYIPGLGDGTFSLEGPWSPEADAALAAIDAAGIVTFDYYPAGSGGSAGTNVKYSGNCFMTDHKITGDIGDAQQMTADFQMTGTYTRALV